MMRSCLELGRFSSCVYDQSQLSKPVFFGRSLWRKTGLENALERLSENNRQRKTKHWMNVELALLPLKLNGSHIALFQQWATLNFVFLFLLRI